MTEDQIFMAIFNYVDHLFSKIRPKKLFFLAVDGVAPRAKMNQQRARRFRTAKDNAEARQKAIQRGEELPKEAPFDSNCITPGTPFMTRLQEQLKYFINKKITEDASWHHVEVILSGHEVPGEGEHKIMEYLRLAKSQPDYDPNVRHCLYGLDADLMMLGLLSHEPHFALLREEVTFGRSRKKSPGGNPEAQNFFLMHLSLFREYLDAEFSTLQDHLSFKYDVERVIDDFIVLAYFVGNDFLPNLPGLHINEGALAYMFKVYKTVLMEGGGYLNDGGQLQLDTCERFLRKLGEQERELFEVEVGDVKWLQGKRTNGQSKQASKKSQLVLSKTQREYYDKIKSFVLSGRETARLTFSTNIPARDRTFIINLANELGVSHTIDALGEGKDLPQHHIILDWDEDDDEDDEESMEARQRVLRRWDAAEIIDEDGLAASLEAEEKQKLDEAFVEWKREYYKEKMEINYDNQAQMSKLVYHYVEGLQWIAYYYYNGVASWEWFYPYHYAPKITDLVNIGSLEIKFDIGRPFLPFEQLMGVLPAASRQHIPEAFRELMTDPGSPIIDFYPADFELDMNGKKADWEAVIKIPFMDETRLLRALQARENQLTKEEKSRNRHGDSFIFELDAKQPHSYPSPLPGVFPEIAQCVCSMRIYRLPTVGSDGFVKGLCAGAQLGVRALAGFPTMKTLPHTATLGFHGVQVFNMESPNESMIIALESRFEGCIPEEIAKTQIGQRVFVNWPFLQEALVSSMTDEFFRYEIKEIGGRKDVVKIPHNQDSQDRFYKSSERIEHYYSKRYGTITGPIEIVLNVRLLKGMKLQEDGALVKDYGSYHEETDIALQAVVGQVEFEDPRYKEQPAAPLPQEYPVGSRVFFLGNQGYGLAADVVGYDTEKLHIKLLKPTDAELVEGLHFTREKAIDAERGERYMPSWQVAKQLGISSLALSKVTSSLHVISKKSDQRYNLGLNLKFESKKRKVLGYSRKTSSGWEYSQRAVALIREYKDRFPELFVALEKRSRNDLYEDTEIYPEELASKKLNEIKEWLKEAGVKDFERVSLDTSALTKNVIKDIEERVDEVYKRIGDGKIKAVTVKNVPRPAVLKPAHARHRLSHQVFDLGDRVMYAMDSGSVPLAAQGTVVGMEGNFLDVVFDQSFMGGSSLGDRCQPNRGLVVNKDAVLNLTHMQPPIDGSRPSQAIPINRPIPKFAMRSGGNALAQQQNSAHKSPAPPMRNAWTEGGPTIMARNAGPRSGFNEPPRFENQERSVAGKKQTFAGASGVTIAITKHSTPRSTGGNVGPKTSPPHVTSVAKENVRRKPHPSRPEVAAPSNNVLPNGSATMTQRQQEKAESMKRSAPSVPSRQGAAGEQLKMGPTRNSGASAPHGASQATPETNVTATATGYSGLPPGGSTDEAEMITQSLKNMLHIGNNHPPPATTVPLMPVQVGFQPIQMVPVGMPVFTQPQFPMSMAPAIPIQYGTAPHGPPQAMVMDPNNLEVSRQLMAMLQPQQAAQPHMLASFSPYTVAAGAMPVQPVQNELAELIKHKEPSGRGRGRGAPGVPGPRRNTATGPGDVVQSSQEQGSTPLEPEETIDVEHEGEEGTGETADVEASADNIKIKDGLVVDMYREAGMDMDPCNRMEGTIGEVEGDEVSEALMGIVHTKAVVVRGISMIIEGGAVADITEAKVEVECVVAVSPSCRDQAVDRGGNTSSM
ncbi:hypothetical protein SpCBS45565_g05555 [Spizellomyces sp. 'palustris']|nr:hypothetical protein SpCBS45565_g05555 [Spizellomyces sp. 'palustris']